MLTTTVVLYSNFFTPIVLQDSNYYKNYMVTRNLTVVWTTALTVVFTVKSCLTVGFSPVITVVFTAKLFPTAGVLHVITVVFTGRGLLV